MPCIPRLIPVAAMLALALVGQAAPPAKDLNPVRLKETPRHAPVPLVVGGAAQAAIVAAPGAEGLAADLQQYLEIATGAKLAITNTMAAPAIVLGDWPEAQAAGLDSQELPPEGFAIKTDAAHVFIVGDAREGRQGLRWGVCEFLERFVGMRWYFPAPRSNDVDLGLSIPRTKDLSVEAVWLEDAPVFRKREIWPVWSNPWIGAGNNLIPLHTFLRAADTWPIVLQVHTPNWAKTPYATNCPEVFQLKKDGTRDFGVLCYGNPKTLEKYLEQIQNALDKKPYTLGLNGKAITVSPADVELACYCPDCQKLVDPSGGQYGSYSRVMAAFVDQLARAVRQRWPDQGFMVIFLPYLNYTAAPEGFKFPDNVEVQICGMPGLASYKEEAIRKAEQDNLDRWMAMSGRKIQNWHYDVWPAHKTKAAYHYAHVIKRHYLANRDKTVGTFINGETDHWPRQNISLYCWLKCLWNPDYDVDAAIVAFCERMFGPAANTMRELVGMQHDGWERSAWPGGRFSPKGIYEVSFPREKVRQMEALLARAYGEARGDALVTARLDYYAPALKDFFEESRNLCEGAGFKPLQAQKIGEKPTMDGLLDDPVWQRAPASAFVKAVGADQGKPALSPTTVQGLWTPEGLILGFRMTEPHPDKLVTSHGGHDNGELWWDDNVEIFLDVTGKKEGEFYQFIVTAVGDIWDSKQKDHTWECQGLEVKTARGQDYWSAEVFIPFAAFGTLAHPVTSTDKRWFGNFTRHRMADGANEYQRMNTTGSTTSDNLADFAEIRFIE